MKIAIIVAHDPAGTMINLNNAINKHTEHDCRHIRMLDIPPLDYDYDLDIRNKNDLHTIQEVLEEADVLHITSCAPYSYGGSKVTKYNHLKEDFEEIDLPYMKFPDASFGLQDLEEWNTHIKDKKVVVHFHGDWPIRKTPEKFFDYFEDKGYKVLVSTIDLLKFLPFATWAPNIIAISDELYMPKRILDDFIRIMFAGYPSGMKNYYEFARVSCSIAYKYPNVISRAIGYTNHKECLRIKQSADILFDQLLLLSYGVSALEGVSMGQAVLVGLDDFFLYHFKRKVKCKKIPFIIIDDDILIKDISHISRAEKQLRKKMGELIDNKEYLEETQKYSRTFMEKHMSDKKLANDMIKIYNEA